MSFSPGFLEKGVRLKEKKKKKTKERRPAKSVLKPKGGVLRNYDSLIGSDRGMAKSFAVTTHRNLDNAVIKPKSSAKRPVDAYLDIEDIMMKLSTHEEQINSMLIGVDKDFPALGAGYFTWARLDWPAIGDRDGLFLSLPLARAVLRRAVNIFKRQFFGSEESKREDLFKFLERDPIGIKTAWRRVEFSLDPLTAEIGSVLAKCEPGSFGLLDILLRVAGLSERSMVHDSLRVACLFAWMSFNYDDKPMLYIGTVLDCGLMNPSYAGVYSKYNVRQMSASYDLHLIMSCGGPKNVIINVGDFSRGLAELNDLVANYLANGSTVLLKCNKEYNVHTRSFCFNTRGVEGMNFFCEPAIQYHVMPLVRGIRTGWPIYEKPGIDVKLVQETFGPQYIPRFSRDSLLHITRRHPSRLKIIVPTVDCNLTGGCVDGNADTMFRDMYDQFKYIIISSGATEIGYDFVVASSVDDVRIRKQLSYVPKAGETYYLFKVDKEPDLTKKEWAAAHKLPTMSFTIVWSEHMVQAELEGGIKEMSQVLRGQYLLDSYCSFKLSFDYATTPVEVVYAYYVVMEKLKEGVVPLVEREYSTIRKFGVLTPRLYYTILLVWNAVQHPRKHLFENVDGLIDKLMFGPVSESFADGEVVSMKADGTPVVHKLMGADRRIASPIHVSEHRSCYLKLITHYKVLPLTYQAMQAMEYGLDGRNDQELLDEGKAPDDLVVVGDDVDITT